MQRMHSLGLKAVLMTLLYAGSFATPAQAALLRPNDAHDLPDITAFANGSLNYTYNPTSQTGVFQFSNVPFLMTGGKAADGSYLTYDVTSTSSGQRSQTLTAVLDSSGNLVSSAQNSFQMYGTVAIGDKTYTGLLLSGTPTAFGSQTLKGLGVGNEDLFDMTLKITGGSLSSLYGPDAYIRVTTDANTTFDGVFTKDFSSEKIYTNTHTIASIVPSPVPEPTTLVVLLACGAGLLYRGRKRISSQQLSA